MEPWEYRTSAPEKKSIVQTIVEASVVLYAACALAFVSVAAEPIQNCAAKIRKMRKKKKC